MADKLDWIGYGLSMAGVLLNAYKIIWCWPVWIAANLAWLGYFFFGQKSEKTEWALIALNATYCLMEAYGWYQWTRL